MTDADTQNPLTERQIEVLELVAQGATNKEIGHALSISEHTVRKHLQNIFEKLDVSSRTEATTLAYQRGWVRLPSPEPAADAQTEEREAEADTLEATVPAGIRVDPRVLAGAGLAGVAVIAVLVWLLVTRQLTPAIGGSGTPTVNLDRWTDTTSLSRPRTGLALTAFKGDLYAIAGETSEGPTGLAERLAPDDGEWRRLTDKPTPVRDVGAVVVGGEIYVPGGCVGDGSPIDSLEVYDPGTDTWSEKARMPKSVCAYAIAALEGDIYVFGGWDGGSYTQDAFTYDPDQDVWATVSPMPTARGYAGAAAIEGQIYVVGGYDGRQDLAVVEAYAPSNDQAGETSWIEHTPLPDGRAGAGVVTVQSKLFIIGGGWDAGRESAIQYDVRTDSWTLFPSPTAERWRNMGVTVLDTRSETRIYAVGGLEDDDYVATNREYTALYNVILPLQQR
ncbi:MAG: Transcriptional regulatory protein DesR [Anaerolineales bacterium]|nr:Transcriptional regulatory protein DesR [Anaerolineales bacterium]